MIASCRHALNLSAITRHGADVIQIQLSVVRAAKKNQRIFGRPAGIVIYFPRGQAVVLFEEPIPVRLTEAGMVKDHEPE